LGAKLSRYGECEYPAFISFAGADNKRHLNWIFDFHEVLSKSLDGRLDGRLQIDRIDRIRMNRLYFSEDAPIVTGGLTEELAKRVRNSFVLIIVAGDGYAGSDGALAELQCFHESFGVPGLQNRLYIVALSEAAIDRLKDSPQMQGLLLDDHQRRRLAGRATGSGGGC
jgi:hypothetical protein